MKIHGQKFIDKFYRIRKVHLVMPIYRDRMYTKIEIHFIGLKKLYILGI